jgi:GNAT superfamily N-acetyltransferase
VIEPALRRAVPDDAAAIAEVQVASWHTTYRGLIADETLDGLSVAARTERWGDILRREGRVTVVAEAERDGGRGIVGFVEGGPNRILIPPFDAFSAEMNGLYLLASHQRLGLGRRLVRALSAALLELGHSSLIVWVLETNPARGFYERLGGRFVGAHEIAIDGRPYPDVAYGWDDISILLA